MNLQYMKTFDDKLLKSLVTIFLVMSFLLLPKVGFHPEGGGGFDLYRNILFPFSHANVFHLACNIICLWQIRRVRRFIVPSFVISFIASVLPFYQCVDIMGFSGILFAIIGIQYGVYSSFFTMFRKTVIFFVITAFLPNVAVLFHLYCIVIAFSAGWLYQTYRLWKKAVCI